MKDFFWWLLIYVLTAFAIVSAYRAGEAEGRNQIQALRAADYAKWNERLRVLGVMAEDINRRIKAVCERGV